MHDKSLGNYYRLVRDLKKAHGYDMSEIESWMPFELWTVFVPMIEEEIEKEKG